MNTLYLPLHFLLCSALCFQWTAALDSKELKTAVNIAWSSVNFKTILEWEPKPVNHTYSVDVSGEYSDWKTKCFYTKETECDVSNLLEDVNDTYTARIISNVKDSEHVEEFPHADSVPFTPYKQTKLGKPVIEQFELDKESGNLHVFVKDAVTPFAFPNNTFKTVRDIFQSDFMYTLFYRKASSTGRKQATSATNEIVINVDKGESYCFYVRATIPSRKVDRDSPNSAEKCTPSNGSNEFNLSILVAVITAVVLIVVIIIMSVIICKCRKAKAEKSKETVPLNKV
ncbi:tissue factor isoform X1 [Pelobates fuscus]|uniref:tissue factor isoform X1 n=1 Tax=Pelobates fuscus TaxID=191477 RepID=UPI002FE4F826